MYRYEKHKVFWGWFLFAGIFANAKPSGLHTHTHTHTYIYIYMCVCVCVYIWLCEKEIWSKVTETDLLQFVYTRSNNLIQGLWCRWYTVIPSKNSKEWHVHPWKSALILDRSVDTLIQIGLWRYYSQSWANVIIDK